MTKTRRTFHTREEVVERMRKTIKASGLTAAKWATNHNLSAALVSAVLTRKTPPGPKILRALGIDTKPYFALIHTYEDTTKTEPHVEDWNDNETGDTTDGT